MTQPVTLDLDQQTMEEISMVDLAVLILKKVNEPYYYRDLMQEIARLKGLSEQEVTDVIAQLYTEINIDGRFACVGQNLWGLKRWYPTDRAEDGPNVSRVRLIEDDDLDDDYEDVLFDDDDDLTSDDEDDTDLEADDDSDDDSDNDDDSDDDDFDEDDVEEEELEFDDTEVTEESDDTDDENY